MLTIEPPCPASRMAWAARSTPTKLVPVEPPTRRPSTALTWRIAARLSASGTLTIASTQPAMKLRSTRGRPMPSIPEPPGSDSEGSARPSRAPR